MQKNSQSILDLLNILPLQGIIIKRSPLSNKEAKTLFKIWNSDKNDKGHFLVPQELDATQIASLTTKGMVKAVNSGYELVMGDYQPALEITPKGKAIIRNIILFSEKSSFENKSGDFDYESIHMAIDGVGTSKEAKTASRHNAISDFNWLYRAIWKSQ